MTGLGMITLGMLVALTIAIMASLRGDVEQRLVAVQLVGVIGVQIVLVRSLADGVPYYADVALLFAVMSVIGTLLFARFLERWL